MGLCNYISTFPSYTTEQLIELQQSDPNIEAFLKYYIIKRLPNKRERQGVPQSVQAMLRQTKQFSMRNGILYRDVKDPKTENLHQLVLPLSMKSKVLTSLHDQFGHQGIERTISLIRSRFYWPNMYADVKKWIANCERCTIAKLPRPSVRNPLGH